MNAFLRWIGRCHFPLLMMLSVFPPLLILLYVAFPSAPGGAPLLLCACLPLSMLCAAVPARLRLAAASGFSVMLLGAGVFALPLSEHPALLVIPVACCMLLFASLPFIARGVHSVSPALFIVGVVSHIAANLFFHSKAAGTTDMALYLKLAFFTYLPLFLLAMNRITLDNASLSRYHLPALMRRVNILLTLAFLALALLIASVPAAARGLYALWRAMRTGLRALGALLSRLLPGALNTGGAGMGGGMLLPIGMEPLQPPSAFAVFLERLSSVLAFAALVFGCLLFLRLLFKLTIRLLRAIPDRLRRFAASAAEDYEDEITDTREGSGQAQSTLRLRRRAAQRTPDTPGEAIRYRYARLLARHKAWSDSSTARENLPEQTAEIYERARYSPHPVSQADADEFVQGTRNL